jgi:hypothetical protein
LASVLDAVGTWGTVRFAGACGAAAGRGGRFVENVGLRVGRKPW